MRRRSCAAVSGLAWPSASSPGTCAPRGVADADAEAALATIDPEEEKEVAVALARRRAGRTAGLAEPVRRRRLVAFLARRGYPGDVAMAAVNEVLGAEAAGEVGDGSADEAADDGTSLEA